MRKLNPVQQWIIASLGVFGIGLFVYRSIDVDPSAPAPGPAPVGTVEDIETLADRDDVNILFVLVDTLRADRMSMYGYERETTPFLSKLAQTSVRFDRHIAQSSWTKSSMASIWSGLSPLRVGVTKFNHVVPQGAHLPAEILADEGFMTVGLYRNGWVHGYFGFDQGFKKYFRPMGSRKNRVVQSMRPNDLGQGNDENVIEEAIEFLRINGKTSRWFLYLHLMDLHEYIYDAESAKFGTSASDLYDNSILRTDWLISTIYDYLRRAGLVEKTIIVILADHGEAFGERGFEGHAREVLPETTETPLLIALPFALVPGPVVKSMTSNVDVWPTLLDLLGLPGLGDVDGQSRVPEILAASGGHVDETVEESIPTIAYLDENWGQTHADVRPAVSVLEGEYRFVSGRNIAGNPHEDLLLRADGQKENQIEEYPEIAIRLREIAKQYLETKPVHEIEAVDLDQMQLDQLRALGYELP